MTPRMMRVIEPWDQQRIAQHGWLRIAIRPADRAAGRQLVARLRAWFALHGRGCAMIFDAVFCRDLTVAFSEVADCVLFRLTFVEVPMQFVPQPHAHQGFCIRP